MNRAQRLTRLADEWAEFRRRHPRAVKMREEIEGMSPEEREKLLAEFMPKPRPDEKGTVS